MAESRLHQLSARGQSVWIDYLSRDLLHSGRAGAADARRRRRRRDLEPDDLPEGDLAGRRLRRAAARRCSRRPTTRRRSSSASAVRRRRSRRCDLLAPGLRRGQRPGRLRLVGGRPEPRLRPRRHDRRGAAAARAGRPAEPHVKIPATEPGLGAIEEMIARGRNINVTLIFSLSGTRGDRGLHPRPRAARRGRRRPVEGARRSRASSSRASTPRATSGSRRSARTRRSRCAASSRSRTPSSPTEHYEAFSAASAGRRSRRRARTPQRCLWASTSTKNPEYRDVLYVEELIGPAHRQHDAGGDDRAPSRITARSRRRLTEGVDEASGCSSRSPTVGVDYDDVVATLEQEGVRSSPTRSRSCWTASQASAGAVSAYVNRERLIEWIWARDADASGPARTRRTGSAGSTSRCACRSSSTDRAVRPVAPRRGRSRRPARDGRLDARARGAAAQLRRRLLPRPRLDAPDGDPRARGEARPRADALRLLLEVGLDARDALAPRLLLGAETASAGRFRRDHRSGLRARAARRASATSARSSPASRRSAAATRRSRRSGSCPRR